MKRYWVGWKSDCETENPAVWMTGYEIRETFDGKWERGRKSYCGRIDAPSAEEAVNLVTREFPDATIRFCDEKPEDWDPFPDRFPSGTGQR